MANEANQNGDNVEQTGLPTRVLRIEGERTGRLFTNSIRVGRIDKRLRELSMSTNAEQRRQFRLGDEGFSKAIGDFENALDQIIKDLAITSRSSKTTPPANRQQGQGSQKGARPAPKENPAPQQVVAGVVQPKAQTNSPAATAASSAKQQPQQPQQPQGQALAPTPKSKKRNKRKKPGAKHPQSQAPAVAEQKPAAAKPANTNGAAAQQSPATAAPAGKAGQSTDQGKKPNNGQQQKPAPEKQQAATPALT